MPEGTLGPEAVVALHRGLCSSAAGPWWDQHGGKQITLWSPSAADELGRLLSGLVKHLATAGRPAGLRLLCPMDELPGCTSAMAITQHWMHPALGERCAGILSKVEFAMWPLEQISPG